ncbi:hypothetical protein LTS18_009183, partial [Coniosporium uncinatum]
MRSSDEAEPLGKEPETSEHVVSRFALPPPAQAVRTSPPADKSTNRQGFFLGSGNDIWLDIAMETEGLKRAKEARNQRLAARAPRVKFSPVVGNSPWLGEREDANGEREKPESVRSSLNGSTGKSKDLGKKGSSVMPSPTSEISPRSQSPSSWHDPQRQQLDINPSFPHAIFYDEVARHAFLNNEPYVVNTLRKGHVILAAPMSLPRQLKTQIVREEDTPYKRKQRRAYEQGKRNLRKANPQREIKRGDGRKGSMGEEAEAALGYRMPSANSATYLDLYDHDSPVTERKDSRSKKVRFLTPSMIRVRSKETKPDSRTGKPQTLIRTVSADDSGTYWLKSEKHWVPGQPAGPEELYEWVPRWQTLSSKIDANVPIYEYAVNETLKQQGPLPKRAAARPQRPKAWRSRTSPQTTVATGTKVGGLPQRPHTLGVDQRSEEPK